MNETPDIFLPFPQRRYIQGADRKTVIQVNEDRTLSEEYKKEIRIEWFGMDGALVLLYILLGCFYGYGIINQVEWIIGYGAPVIAIGIVIGVFAKYLTEVASVMNGKNR